MAMSAPTRAASASSASVAPGSSGLGKATVGKSGSGLNWRCDGVHVVEAGEMQRAQRQFAADAVHGGQGNAHRSRGAAHGGGALHVEVDEFGAGGGDGLAWDLVGRRRGGHRRLDLAVGRGDDLQAAVEVHLVAVVGGRVVGGGDLHTGSGSGVADREGDDGRRHRVRQRTSPKTLEREALRRSPRRRRRSRAWRPVRPPLSSRRVRGRSAPCPPPSWPGSRRPRSSRRARRGPGRATRRCRSSAGGRTEPRARRRRRRPVRPR